MDIPTVVKGMVMRTKVSYVRKGSKSLKVTIPEGIVDVLMLKHGDSLDWQIQAKADKVVVNVMKAE